MQGRLSESQLLKLSVKNRQEGKPKSLKLPLITISFF